MKRLHFSIFLALVFIVSCIMYVPYGEEAPPPEPEEVYDQPAPGPGLDVSYFYEYLSPYGVWIYHPVYRYVWIPYDMPFSWRPYTRGHWIWTDYGWTWRSTITWGWAPFHYGRWGWDREFGWFWAPDVVWGPAWVTWRSSNVYIGWAPLPPNVRFVAGVGIRHVSYNIPHSHWIFVDGTHFMSPSLHLHIFPFERNVTIVRYTVHQTNIYVRNNIVVNEGVGFDRVQRITKQRITKVQLKDSNKPELRREAPGQVEVYRPKIKKSDAAKPKTVINRQDAKVKITERKISIKEKEKEITPVEREKSLRDLHDREIKLLKNSQEKDVQDFVRRKEEEKKAAKTEAEKEKIEKEYQNKVINLKKTHEQEKTQIIKRHEEEEKKVVKQKEEKKEPEKKKKVVKKKKKEVKEESEEKEGKKKVIKK